MEEEAVRVYRELAKHPVVNRAQFANVDESVISIDSVWIQRCIEKNTWHKSLRTYTLSKDGFKSISVSKPQVLGDSIWKVSSPSGAKTVVVRKHIPKDSKLSEEKWFFEIWAQDGCCERAFDVSSADKHGPVYGNDVAFGSLSWNLKEDKITYVAEKKAAKGLSFFSEPPKTIDEKDLPVAGNKFLYKEDWGENLENKEQPVICVLDLTSGAVEVVNDESLNESSCGQVVWCPIDNSVVFCAIAHGTCKLGIIYCPIRKTTLYHYNCDTKVLKPLNDADDISIRSPRFSPDGSKLVYLECSSGGPHCKCFRLKMVDWQTLESKVLVEVINSADVNAEFQGIFCSSLQDNCWHPANTHVFLATPSKARKDIFAVNISSSKVTRLTNVAGDWSMEDIHSGYILASVSTLNSVRRLAIANLKDFQDDSILAWSYLEAEKVISNLKWEVLQHSPRIPHPDYASLIYETLILQPIEGESKGLVMFPHGGPHSGYTSRFALYFCFLAKLGFTVAFVNYRGSVGYGQDSIESLLGNVGDHDIKDVQQCAEEILLKYNIDKEKVVVMGGSHGGFISSHLIGQYPDFYKAAVIDGAVTNFVSKVSVSDIPDWCHVEAGWQSYVPCQVPSAELYTLMYSKSPVAHVHKVKAATLILHGQADRRVPPSQGIEYYKALRARGVTTKLYMFPDTNHSSETIEVESNNLVNIYLWFTSHLQG